jgi:hypothetical protein
VHRDISVFLYSDAISQNDLLTIPFLRLQEKQDTYQAMFKKYKLSDIPESDHFTEKDQKRLEQEAAKAQMGSTFFCIKTIQE